MSDQRTKFLQMDLGSNPVASVPIEDVEVVVSAGQILGDYARAFVKEARRVNPARFEQVGLTESEMLDYCQFLLAMRVKCVHDDCPMFRQLKILYIPSYLQFALSMIGVVMDRPFGLRLIPVMDDCEIMDLSQALQVSDKIGAFERDLQIVQDAMPRGIDGDINVMGTALIAGYVRSYRKVDHPAATYVTAFLNMKLRAETAFAALYRVQYDDITLIQMALSHQKGLFT